jgi:O-antigen/teichoic acid export membrane protein
MSRLTRNVLYNLTGQALVLVLSFVAVKFIFHRLGDDAFGLIYFNQLVAAVLVSVLQLGISASIVREVSAYLQSDPEYIRALVRTATLLYWLMYAVAAVVLYFAAPFLIEHWIRLSSMDQPTAVAILRVLGIAALLILPRLLYSGLLNGQQRMEFNNLIDVTVAAVQQIGIVAILAFHGGLFGVVYWIAGCYVLSIVTYFIFSLRFFPMGALAPGFSADAIRRNLRYVRNTMATSLLSLIHSQADKVVLSKLMPVVSFGLYSFASGTAGRAAFVTNAVAQAAFPSFSNLYHSGERKALMIQYRKLHDLLTFGLVPVFAAIPFAALPVFGYVFTPAAAQLLLLPVTFLSLGYYMNGTINMPYAFSLAIGRADIAARSNLVALITVLPVTVGLIAFYGLNGAAFSWVYYHLFLYVFMVPVVCRECLETSYPAWQGKVIKALLVAFVAYGAAWLAATSLATGMGLVAALVVGYITATLIFGAAAYNIIEPELRGTIVRSSRDLIARGVSVLQAVA